MKIALVGGHLTPALAVLDYIKKFHPTDELIFIGRIYARYQTKQPAHERNLVMEKGVSFIPFHAGKLDFSSLPELLRNIFYLILSYPRAFLILKREKPDIILAFGSYLSVPLCLVAKLFKIKVVIHEQTRQLGTANSFLAHVANFIALSHNTNLPSKFHKKAVITGNPIRPNILKYNNKKPSWYKQSNTSASKIIYITGGSQGSEMLNTATSLILPNITKKWFVIHQCGVATKKRNYLEEAQLKANSLNRVQRSRYHVQEWFGEQEVSWIYQHALMAISRAGANTVDELTAQSIPSILIPLPFSHKQEQRTNAQEMTQLGGAIMLEQKDLTPELLISAINEVEQKNTEMRTALNKKSLDSKSAAKIYQLLLKK